MVSLLTLTKLATPALIDARGVVINIGSTAGHLSVPGWGTYFSTKVSVRSLSDTLRRELRAYGVRVSLVEPGPFATEFGERAGMGAGGGLPPEAVAQVIVRLAERPRRIVIVPWFFGPLMRFGGALDALVPDLADLAFYIIGRRKLRQQAAEQGQQALPS